MSEVKKNSIMSYKDFISGSTAGIVQVLLGQPLDILKVRMQTSSNPMSLIETAKNLLKNEGAMGFYKGTTSPLVGVSFYVAVQFSANEIMKRYFKRKNGENEKLSISQLMLSGMFAGFSGSFIVSPVELFRIKMQVQGTNGSITKYSNTVDCFVKVVSKHGIRGFYQGLSATLMREVPAGTVYFGVYESLMRGSETTYKKREQIPLGLVTIYGGLAGLALWVCTFPMDVIKSRMQSDSLENKKYSNIMSTIKLVFAENGAKGFFKGIVPCLVRAPPINAATFLTFEAVQKLQNKN